MLLGEDIDGTVCSVSGGERRRVSIGIALVTDPAALFLDEPTTGLDSDSALSIVCLLKRLAARGRTVLCTIHQPSSDICERFDDFMLLGGGRMVYCGAWRAAEAWFDALGKPRPAYRSLAEHLMVLCKDKATVDVAAAAHADSFSLDDALGDAEAGGGYERALSRWSLRHTVTSQAIASAVGGADPHATGTAMPVWYQIVVLAVRFVRHMWRAPLNTIVQLVQYCFFGTLVGLTYWKVSLDASGGTFDRVASLWFIVACLTLQPSQNAVAVFARDRNLLRREMGARLYTYFAFFSAKSLTMLPSQLLYALSFSLLTYFMIGYQAVAAKFGIYYITLVLTILASDTVGQICAALHREYVVGQIVNGKRTRGWGEGWTERWVEVAAWRPPTCFLPPAAPATATITPTLTLRQPLCYLSLSSGMLCLLLLMFTGFIQTKTPPYFVWLKKSSYVAFAYSAVVRNEFSGLKLQGPLLAVDGLDAIPDNVNNGLSVAVNLGFLTGIMVGIRVLCYAWVSVSIRRQWL